MRMMNLSSYYLVDKKKYFSKYSLQINGKLGDMDSYLKRLNLQVLKKV